MNRCFLLLLLILTACREEQTIDSPPPLPAAGRLHNVEAIVPPQCYTKTESRFNPCYVCHQNQDGRPNTMADGSLQLEYAFSDVGETNHWLNLFRDFTDAVAAYSDADIDTWVATENYTDLAPRLRKSEWRGYIPDLKDLHLGADAFDGEGFALDGSGWVAFNYKPLPSTFWPLNGATDDVMIRLPAVFRESRELYRLNLALLEAAIKDLAEITVNPVDETALNIDLDGDGQLSRAVVLKRGETYLGAASDIPVTPFLYPEGTEFLHSVRYLGITEDNRIVIPPRMKELRYMRKIRFLSPAALAHRYYTEKREKQAGELPQFVALEDRGFNNGFGWEVLGFIEDKDGKLRPQKFEENLFCMGCHGTVGATIDQTFAFARKPTGPKGWRYIDLTQLHDAPTLGEGRGEIAAYFSRVGGSDEFRQNKETLARFFNPDGTVNLKAVEKASYAELITPSPQRARALNKAYRVLVEEQSYVFGRDAHVKPMRNVFTRIDPETAPVLAPDKFVQGDLRLDWSASTKKRDDL
ncbi:MAG: hypothetical protein QNK37_35810 [Acidobacteriota bacterium]|nr:hypothetical protein [Acidobacteriota bacterium]